MSPPRSYIDFFDEAPEAMVLLGEGGLIRRVNRQFTRLFGYEPCECEGQPVDELLAPGASQQAARETTNRVLRGEHVTLEAVRHHKAPWETGRK